MGSIAEDRKSFAANGLCKKSRQHAPVVYPHARTVRVKNPDDAGFHTVIIMVGHSDGFEKAFRFVVHATRTYGIDISPIFFRLGVYMRITVYFGSRGYQNSCILLFSKPQKVVGAVCADFERLNGHLQIINRAGGRSKIQDVIEFARHVNELRHIVVIILKVFFGEEVFDVGDVTSEQIIHGDNLVAFRQKAIAEVRADKTGCASDKYSFFCH